jgi:glycosyltransferase involved in cell wall biosynthesis
MVVGGWTRPASGCGVSRRDYGIDAMFLIVSNVPFRPSDATGVQVASDWGRSLLLLRDSFNGRFGEIVVAAPTLPPGDGDISEQRPHLLHAQRDGVRFVKLGETHWRARHFWRHYPQIRRTCDELARHADVVHAGINNLWQPYSFIGFNAGCRAGKTTVFVQDGDVVGRLHDLALEWSGLHQLQVRAYCALYERLTRRAVARADLSLLKGQAVLRRFRRYARNAQEFYDTSYSESDIVSHDRVRQKCEELRAGATIGCLALGRLADYKHVDHTLRAVAEAAAAGANVRLDVIGAGPAADELRNLAEALKIGALVRFQGARPYGPELLREVQQSHVLVFTSLADETPRALFDGLAAGCALLAYDLPFTREVVRQCAHGVCTPRGDCSALADQLRRWDRERGLLANLIGAASVAAPHHAARAWYARRAAWTIAAHDARLWRRPASTGVRSCP